MARPPKHKSLGYTCKRVSAADASTPTVPIRHSHLKIMAGGHGAGATPVPIPNTVVKPHSADGTARETGWESTTPPAQTTKPR